MSMSSDDTPKKSKAKKADRNDPARFVDPGLNYRGKLIGVEDVQDPRGDKMCQVAMAKLKAAVKTIGDHKQKITINVSLDGIKIIDEKTESLVYFHPVHRVSFISRDASDSRAFGYVFGAGGGSHQFYGIKTEKVAEGIVLCLRDLFQVVFEMKKQGNELKRRSHELVEDRLSDPRSFSSPKPPFTRGAWLKSDHYTQSLTHALPSPSQMSTEPCRASVTPVNVKKGVVGMSSMRQSPVMLSCPANPPKQVISHLSHHTTTIPTTTTTAPEPIYQNASVLSGRFHCQLPSTTTCSTPPAHSSVRFSTPENSRTPVGKQLSDSTKEWVSFEFDAAGKPSLIASESKPSVRKKDPFANDPFFSKTQVSDDDGGEVIIWSPVETQVKVASVDASRDARVEPIYGFFVEPDAFAEFSGLKDEPTVAAWIPAQVGVAENATLGPIPCEGALGPAPENSSDRESCSDVVSFPSPDAPPPPLPQNTPLILDYQAPVPPPRPGSSCSKSDPYAALELIDRWVEGIPPALPSRPSAVGDSLVGASEVPPPPPPRSDLATFSPMRGEFNVDTVNTDVLPSLEIWSPQTMDHTTDPFAVAISKMATKPDSATDPSHTPIQSAPNYASTIPHEFPTPSPIPPRKATLMEDSTTTLCADSDLPSSSPSSAAASTSRNGEFHDPFSALDPFASNFRSDPFASISDVLSSGSAASDPFGKRFSVDLNNHGASSTATDSTSDAFDDVFSSRDDSDEKTESNSRSPASVGSNGLHRSGEKSGERSGDLEKETMTAGDKSSACFNSSDSNAKVIQGDGSTDLPAANFSGSNSVAGISAVGSRAESKSDPFDSVMDDFTRRFPTFDDNCWTLVTENSTGQSVLSRDAHPADALQPVGGATAGKSRLSIPKSSDSSSNSEIAEAFSDDGSFSMSRNVKQPMKS